MKTDPTPFIAAALMGIASHQIHHQVDNDGKYRVTGKDVAKRAVELGMATALAVDELIEQLEQSELEAATAPEKPKKKAQEKKAVDEKDAADDKKPDEKKG